MAPITCCPTPSDRRTACAAPCNAGGKNRTEIVDRNGGLISDQANIVGGLHGVGVHVKVQHEGVIYRYSGDSRPTNLTKSTNETASARGMLPYQLLLHLRRRSKGTQSDLPTVVNDSRVLSTRDKGHTEY